MLSNNKFKAVGISAALATTLGLGLAPAAALAKPAAEEDLLCVVRLYNKWSGEHLFSTDAKEIADLEARGWENEGTYWKAPAVYYKDSKGVEHHQAIKDNKYMPVYRLYNPYTSDHLYTTDLVEYTNLMAAGWNGEDIKFASAAKAQQDNQAKVDTTALEDDVEGIYRQYNPNVTVGTHNYGGLAENKKCLDLGWKADGVDADGRQQPMLYGYELKDEQVESYLLKSIGELQEAYKAKLKEFNDVKDAVLADVKADKYKEDAYKEKLDKIHNDIVYYQGQLKQVNLYINNYRDKTTKKINDYLVLKDAAKPEFAETYNKLQTASTVAAQDVATKKNVVGTCKDVIKTDESEISKKNLEIEKQNLEIKLQNLVLDDEKASDADKKAAADAKAIAEDAVKTAKNRIKELEAKLQKEKDKLETAKSNVILAKQAHDKAKKAFRDFRYDQSLPLGQLFRDLVFIQDNDAQAKALTEAFNKIDQAVTGYNVEVNTAVESYWKAVDPIKKKLDDNVELEEKKAYYKALVDLKEALVKQIKDLSEDPQLDAEDALGI